MTKIDLQTKWLIQVTQLSAVHTAVQSGCTKASPKTDGLMTDCSIFKGKGHIPENPCGDWRLRLQSQDCFCFLCLCAWCVNYGARTVLLTCPEWDGRCTGSLTCAQAPLIFSTVLYSLVDAMLKLPLPKTLPHYVKRSADDSVSLLFFTNARKWVQTPQVGEVRGAGGVAGSRFSDVPFVPRGGAYNARQETCSWRRVYKFSLEIWNKTGNISFYDDETLSRSGSICRKRNMVNV